MADTIIKLGDFEFAHAEIPEGIPVGGDQEIKLNKYVGGKRTANVLGPDDDDISWSGLFLGSEALNRARFLTQMKSKGELLVFTYFAFKYRVIIKTVSLNVQKYYQVPYHIVLCVIEDLTSPILVPPPAGFLDALVDDLDTMFDILALITQPNIGVAVEELSAYIGTLLPNTAITSGVRSTLDGLIRNVISSTGTAISSVTESLKLSTL